MRGQCGAGERNNMNSEWEGCKWEPLPEPSANEEAVDFIKAPDFRVTFVDGVVGSVMDDGMVHAVVFSERWAIPKRLIFQRDAETGELGAEVEAKRLSRASLVRHVAGELVMTADKAEVVGKWLLEQVKMARSVNKPARGSPKLRKK